MFGRFRKGRLLIELLGDPAKYREFLQRVDNRDLFRENKHQFQNNFQVRLQSKDIEISPEKITGFRLNQKKNEGILTVKTSLCINEWIDDFKSVDFAEIVLLDTLGNINRLLDFDIDYIGHRFACDYSKSDILSPVFDYEIVA